MSRKGAKSRTLGRKLRSTGTKARTRGVSARQSQSSPVTKLKAHARDLEKKLSEALEQQTASSEVLQVISSSPGELEPVFQAVLANAVRLCGANFGTLSLCEGDARFRAVAMHNPPPAYAEERRRHPVIRYGPESDLGRCAATKQAVQIADLAAEPAAAPLLVKFAGARTLVSVPMLKEDKLIGAISIYRQEVRPFSEKQIELVKSFAAQAVIAIENTRLLNELRQRTDDLSETLEQQTATSEVLGVISSSPGELEPVFQSMLENATRICEAKFGVLYRFDDNAFHLAAMVNAPSAFADFIRQRGRFLPEAGNLLDRAWQTRQVVHTIDQATEQIPTPSAKLAGARSQIIVPMLKGNELIGAINIYRQEIRPFTDKQIELVQNFAAQAVIAIENTRLLNELRESLQQQTATSDVLKVISRSTFDLQTVLHTLVESAGRLCRADRSTIRLVRDGAYHHLASHGYPPEHIEYMTSHPIFPSRASMVGRVALEGKAIHIMDVQTDTELTYIRAPGVERLGTGLGVPLLREGKPIGTLLLMRTKVEPFTDKQIELATTFADQAVIAIENVRLFDEVRARNRDLTALGEVGRAVSSTLDLKAVLKTIIDRAVDLSDTDGGSIFYYREDVGRFELGETSGFDEEVVERYRKLDIAAGQTGLSEAITNRQPLQIPEITKRASNPLRELSAGGGLARSPHRPAARRRGSARCAGSTATRARCVLRRRDQPHAKLRRPIRDCPGECPPVRGDRPEGPRA